MNYHTKDQSQSSGQPVGNIQSNMGSARARGPSVRRRKTKFTVNELIALGNEHHQNNNLEIAESAYRAVLAHCPNHPIALQFLGVLAQQSGNPEAAVKLISQAIAVADDYHQAHNNLGNAYDAMDDIEKAAESYERALDIKPDYTDALFNLGLMKRKLRKYEEAKEILEKCADLEPRRADVHFELGQVHQRLANRTRAQICYQVAMSIDPNHGDSRVSYGNVLQTIGKFDESVDQYDLAIEHDADNIQALNAKGVALRKVGRFDESMDVISHSEELDPTNIETLNALGSAYQTIGDNDKAAECYLRAVRLAPHFESPHKCLLFVALNMPQLSSQELFDIHREVRGYFDRPDVADKVFNDRDKNPDRKLRIGYVSSDFRTHVVAMNILPVIANHNHDDFEVFLYGQVEYPDTVTENFKELTDHWRSTMQKSNEEVAEMIEEDEIDILLFVAGRFDENRPIIATYRPAPIQVSFHDCATSGLEAMDYYLTDDILHPQNTQEQFTEELYRLPNYYQYPIQHGLPEITPCPALENGYVTFGCFNKPEKINDDVIELWSQVLKAVPNSKLLMKYFNHYNEPTMKERYLSRFRENGIEEDRILLKCNLHDRQTHLALYNLVDIALDPFPFNGATTTFEALTMGVPVVTLLGRHFVDRVGASIVTHGGFSQLVGKDKEEYIAIAQDLAADIDALNLLRMPMRDNLHQSRLCDGVPYAHNVEAALREMWQTWCETGGHKGK